MVQTHHMGRPCACCLLSNVPRDLSNNSFYGSLPASYNNMTSLEQLDLSYNRLDGSLPDIWSSLSALQVTAHGN